MSSVTEKIYALGAVLDMAKHKAQISKTAALNDVNSVLCDYVQLRDRSPNESNNIFDVLELALLTEDEPFAEKLRQVLLVLGDQANATRVMAMIWRERASGFRREERFEEAVNCSREALRLYPNFANALNELGLALDDLERFDEAISCYRKAIALDDDAGTRQNLGFCLRRKGSFDEAISEYKIVLQRDTNEPEGHYGIGYCLWMQDKNTEAIPYLRKATELSPNNSIFHYMLGRAWEDQGNINQAEQQYKKAIQISPDYFQAHDSLAQLFGRKGDWRNYVKEVREVIRIYPEGSDYHFFLANALSRKEVYGSDESSKQKQLEEALIACKEAIRLASDQPTYYDRLGQILMDQKKYSEAISAFQQAITLDPTDSPSYYMYLVALYLIQGMIVQAGKLFLEIKSLLESWGQSNDDSIKESVNNLWMCGTCLSSLAEGMKLYENENYSQAIPKLKEAIAIIPTIAEAHYSIVNFSSEVV
jgi:tetratricopeptide (TPR) repeat protein